MNGKKDKALFLCLGDSARMAAALVTTMGEGRKYGIQHEIEAIREGSL